MLQKISLTESQFDWESVWLELWGIEFWSCLRILLQITIKNLNITHAIFLLFRIANNSFPIALESILKYFKNAERRTQIGVAKLHSKGIHTIRRIYANLLNV